MTALEASLLASVLTGFFTLAGAFASNILQRSLGQDERMWSRRAETYVALLQYQGSGMVEGQIEAATAPEWAVRDELTAKARAFASNEVLDLWQKSALANLQVQGYAEENHPGTTASSWSWAAEDDAAKDPEMQRLRQASEQAAKQLAANPGRTRRRPPQALVAVPPGPTPAKLAAIQPSPSRAGFIGRVILENPAWLTSMTA